MSRRAGQFREVITSKFISLRDYQVPIKTLSSKLQVRWGWRWLGQDKWPTLRATHINANLGCLDYHVQWDHSSYFILVQIFTLTTYQARFTIFRLNNMGLI